MKKLLLVFEVNNGSKAKHTYIQIPKYYVPTT